MRFTRFEIKNFKGIEHAVLDLSPAGANISTLIGLNESGKTTILEAISRLALTNAEQALYGSGGTKADPASFVPKHRKSNFTGNITVAATITFDDGEKDDIIAHVQRETEWIIDPSSVPDTIVLTRGYKFEASDKKEDIHLWTLCADARTKRAKKLRPLKEDKPGWKVFSDDVHRHLPQVVYFPTFLFTQPERVVLNPGADEGDVNKLYREIIENVALSLKNPLNVQKHIVDRIVTPDNIAKQVLVYWGLARDKQEQINAVLSEISAHLTETVFRSWSKIFGGNFAGREIILQPGIDNSTTGSPKVYLQIILKDGTTQYAIGERSLGFRWFFSFLLFTLYRVSANASTATLFLLDEPASNLHSRAQIQLASSFPKIATGSNQIMYSTHSHYMINPDWLDQAFIVSNSAVDYDDVNETDVSVRGRHTDVHVEKYRSFVGHHPDKTTYFQPVLDKLEVVPSRLDVLRKSVLVEGKGDYLALEYARRVLLKIEGSFAVVPTRGTTGLDELVGLLLGWGVEFVICLDDDRAGRKARTAFVDEWGLASGRVLTLADVDSELSGKAIEGLLTDDDRDLIKKHFGLSTYPTKGQIQLFFSEMLARREEVKLSKKFLDRAKKFQKMVEDALAAL